MAIQIQIRRGLSGDWTTAETILAEGELGLETDTNKFKVGDGTSTWITLDYVIDPTAQANTGDITFSGVKIQGAGSAGESGYSTIELVPETDLYAISTSSGAFGNAGGQYLVIDPTSPDHIHIRAGGPIDQAQAQLILGGEKANITVRDQDDSYDEKHFVTINTEATTGTHYSWIFGNDGAVTFPTLDVDLRNGGVQSGQVLQFADTSQQAIITGPTPTAGNTAQRLIIQGQRASGSGEGGDVYLWGGDSELSGGDIKIYAGDGGFESAGSGGYVNITAGGGWDNGGNINITAGNSAVNSGNISITAGGGSGTLGRIDIVAGGNTWGFNPNGSLTVPGNVTFKSVTETVVDWGIIGNDTYIPDVSSGTVHKMVINDDFEISTLANVQTGTNCTLIIQQDSTGTHVLYSDMLFANGDKAISTGSNAISVISVFYDGTNYLASLNKGFA